MTIGNHKITEQIYSPCICLNRTNDNHILDFEGILNE